MQVNMMETLPWQFYISEWVGGTHDETSYTGNRHCDWMRYLETTC